MDVHLFKSLKNLLTKEYEMDIIIFVGRRGVAQFGRVRGLGPWGRGFESLHPDTFLFGDVNVVLRV